METLREMYEELLSCDDNWSYYNNPPCLTYNTLLSEECSFQFIKMYFSRGEKGTLFNEPYIQQNADILKRRAPHIISTYLLGIIIAESFEFNLEERNHDNMNFKYLWFLACLYHDIGYIYEENPCCEYLKKLQVNGLAALRGICDIRFFCKSEFVTYKEKYIDIYLSARARCADGKMGVIDHGIAGGMMLYDRLRKNYEQAWRKAHSVNCNSVKNSFNCNGLHFSFTHYKYYAKAADAIIAHNIWIDTLNRYLLDKGEVTLEHSKISDKNQTAFILALADTIEPIKKYGIYALDMISCEKGTNEFRIAMPDTGHNDTYKHIKDLENWVDIKVTKEPNNTFLISRE